jgi:hypothetical protein
MRLAVAAGALAAALAGRPHPATAEPSNRDLVLVGLAFAPPTYAIDVTLHEGSHALAALAVGAHVDQLHLLPGIDPHIDTFRFGWTYVHGLNTHADQVAFYLAPKVTDVVLLGAFAAVVYTGAWPHARYGELALTVAATGSWVDFSKDVFLFSHHNDVVKLFDLWGIHGWGQLPARVVYAGAIAGLGVIVAHGYERTFRSDRDAAPLVVPIVTRAF